MSSYSGNATVSFYIERYQDPISGKLLLEEEVVEGIEYNNVEIELSIEGSSYFTPGRYSGAPENCYPDEGGTEITSATDKSNTDWLHLLTEDEINRAKESIIDEVIKEDDFEPESGPDSDLDFDLWNYDTIY